MEGQGNNEDLRQVASSPVSSFIQVVMQIYWKTLNTRLTGLKDLLIALWVGDEERGHSPN